MYFRRIPPVSRERAIHLIPSRRGAEALVVDGSPWAARERHFRVSSGGPGIRVVSSLVTKYSWYVELLICLGPVPDLVTVGKLLSTI